jgi:hypothetical protein
MDLPVLGEIDLLELPGRQIVDVVEVAIADN